MRISPYCVAVCAAASAAFAAAGSNPARADSPTDIVPIGSAINDAFGLLGRYSVLDSTVITSSFAGRPRYSRAQFAAVFKTQVLENADHLRLAKENKQASEAARSVLLLLRQELEAQGVDVRRVLQAFVQNPTPAASLLLQPELRVRAGGDGGGAARGVGIYRATAQGEIGSNVRYVGSFSSWPDEFRRDFDRDTRAAFFPALNELYVEGRAGRHNSFTYGIGRRQENWGPGSRENAVLLSDNAPALDQIRIAFPFNLGGSFLGRNWYYTQIAATYESTNTAGSDRHYFEARRLERHFTPKWTGEFQEAFITTDRDAAFRLAPVPFALSPFRQSVRKISLRGDTDQKLNYTVAAGLSYQASPGTRVYGQFFIDDLKNPQPGGNLSTPRKIAYLAGTTVALDGKTGLKLEYATADPFTYTFRTNNAPWQRDPRTNNFGLPSGSNHREVFVRLSRTVTPDLLVSVSGRDRKRRGDSLPAPTASLFETDAQYRINNRSSVQVWYRVYRQNPFPYKPGDANYPTFDLNAFDPSQVSPGARVRRSELQAAYRFWL